VNKCELCCNVLKSHIICHNMPSYMWRRPIGCLIFIGNFSQKSHRINGSLAEKVKSYVIIWHHTCEKVVTNKRISHVTRVNVSSDTYNKKWHSLHVIYPSPYDIFNLQYSCIHTHVYIFVYSYEFTCTRFMSYIRTSDTICLYMNIYRQIFT